MKNKTKALETIVDNGKTEPTISVTFALSGEPRPRELPFTNIASTQDSNAEETALLCSLLTKRRNHGLYIKIYRHNETPLGEHGARCNLHCRDGCARLSRDAHDEFDDILSYSPSPPSPTY